MKNYKKVSYHKCKDEEFSRKEYFFSMKLEDVRICFKAEYFMISTIKKNFPRKYRNKSFSCISCSPLLSKSTSTGTSKIMPEDSQFHLTHECIACTSLRERYDVATDQGLGDFFREVVKIRAEDTE